MKKKDGRRNNGSENRGLTEDSQLVRGPAELLECMRAIAKREQKSISVVWRNAAEAYLIEQGEWRVVAKLRGTD